MGSDPPGLTPLRRQAEEHVQAAAKLIEETGYHRRDRELAELRTQLDARQVGSSSHARGARTYAS